MPTDQAFGPRPSQHDHAHGHITARNLTASLSRRDFHRLPTAHPRAMRHIAELLGECEEFPLASVGIRSFPATTPHTDPC